MLACKLRNIFYIVVSLYQQRRVSERYSARRKAFNEFIIGKNQQKSGGRRQNRLTYKALAFKVSSTILGSFLTFLFLLIIL